MKTTAFKIFASCVAIVCLALPPVTKAAPALKSDSGTSENPIVQLQGIKNKNLVGLNFVDLKSHHSRLIANKVVHKPAMAVHDPIVSQNDPEVGNRLRKELEGETSSLSEIPNKSNESQDFQQSNEIQNSQQSNEIQNSQQSNDVQNSQSDEVQNSQSDEVQNSQSDEVQNSQSDEVQNSQSDEVQNSQSDEVRSVPQSDEYSSVPHSHEFRSIPQSDEEVQSSQLDEDYQESDDVYKYRGLPNSSQESYEGEGSNDLPEDYDGSVSTNDDQEESDLPKPTPFQRTST